MVYHGSAPLSIQMKSVLWKRLLVWGADRKAFWLLTGFKVLDEHVFASTVVFDDLFTFPGVFRVFLRSPLNKPPFSYRHRMRKTSIFKFRITRKCSFLPHNGSCFSSGMLAVGAEVDLSARSWKTHLAFWKAVRAGREVAMQRLSTLKQTEMWLSPCDHVEMITWNTTGRGRQRGSQKHAACNRLFKNLLPHADTWYIFIQVE